MALRTVSMTAPTLDGGTHLAALITGMLGSCVLPVPETLTQSGSMEGPQTQRAEWRSLSMMNGALFVVLIGVTTRLSWHVVNLVSLASWTGSIGNQFKNSTL